MKFDQLLKLVVEDDLIGHKRYGIILYRRVKEDRLISQDTGAEITLGWLDILAEDWIIYRQVSSPVGDGPFIYWKGHYYNEVK